MPHRAMPDRARKQPPARLRQRTDLLERQIRQVDAVAATAGRTLRRPPTTVDLLAAHAQHNTGALSGYELQLEGDAHSTHALIDLPHLRNLVRVEHARTGAFDAGSGDTAEGVILERTVFALVA